MDTPKTNTSQDAKTGLQREAEEPGTPRQAADDKAQQDADENLPDEHTRPTDDKDPKEVDEMMQGKKLEKKYRGGDATDADEFGVGER